MTICLLHFKPFDSGIYRLLCRTERAELRAQGVDINGSGYLRLGVVDAPAVLRIHIYNRQRSCRRCGAYGEARQRPKHTSYPCNHSFHATKKLQIYELRCKVTAFFRNMQIKRLKYLHILFFFCNFAADLDKWVKKNP